MQTKIRIQTQALNNDTDTAGKGEKPARRGSAPGVGMHRPDGPLLEQDTAGARVHRAGVQDDDDAAAIAAAKKR